MITVSILGAGNVATHLFKAFEASEDVSIVQWYSRRLEVIETYQNRVNIIDNLNNLQPVDVYIIAVSDDAISKLAEQLPFENQLVAHTSGSVSLYDLNKKHKRGVFYPLQTFTKGTDVDFSTVPMCIEALTKKDAQTLMNLGKAIGSETYKVNSDQRKALHLAAVFVNNFTNQLYRVAHEITESEGVEFEILKPLITETARKVQEISPYMAQTGPAKRNDKKTIKKHLNLLEKPEHKAIYNLLTDAIKDTHGKR